MKYLNIHTTNKQVSKCIYGAQLLKQTLAGINS